MHRKDVVCASWVDTWNCTVVQTTLVLSPLVNLHADTFLPCCSCCCSCCCCYCRHTAAVAAVTLSPSPSRFSWGGGYNPEDDSIFFKKAVTLNRRFVLLPASWSFQLSHGPMLLLVFFR